MKRSVLYNRAENSRVEASKSTFAISIFPIIKLLALAGFILAAPSLLRAQSNPPFKNPSLDSNCYFPQIGDPSEMDTIYGSVNEQELGSFVKNLGTKSDGGFGNMLIEDLNAAPFAFDPFTQVLTGPSFNLHNMVKYVQKFIPDGGQVNDFNNGFHFGHFRDRAHLDIFVVGNWRIYWADDDGNYDSTRFSVLKANLRGGDFLEGGIQPNLISPYFAHLTNDTIDDIVTTCYSDYNNDQDTAYALLFKGGGGLYSKDTAFEDTSALMYPMSPNSAAFRACTQADFRGVGRDDLIAADYTNLCYYKNDPPFSIQQFAQAISNDTIFAQWQSPNLLGVTSNQTFFTMRALPKRREIGRSISCPFLTPLTIPPTVVFSFFAAVLISVPIALRWIARLLSFIHQLWDTEQIIGDSISLMQET